MKKNNKTNEDIIREMYFLRNEYSTLKEKYEQKTNELRVKEEELKKCNDKYRFLIENSRDLVFTLNNEGAFVFVSDSVTNLLGYQVNEIVGQQYHQFIHTDDLLRFLEELQYIVETDNQNTCIDYRMKCLDEKWIWQVAKISLLKNNSGSVIGFEAISHDITEQKRAEESLLSSVSLFNAALESTADGIMIIDGNRKITRYNRKFVDMWQIPKEFLSTKRIKPVLNFMVTQLVQPKTFFSIIKKSYRRPEEVSVNTIHLINGHFYELYSQPQKIGSEVVGRVWTFRDVTSQKQTEEKLVNYANQIELKNLELDMALSSEKEATLHATEMAAQAEMANKSKSVFLANMSHEIRTPLNAIIGFSQLLSRDQSLTNTQKEYNVSIIRAGEHLLALINDILELSKIEAGRIVLNPTNIDLHSLIKDIQMIFKGRAQSKHLQLVFETSNNLPRFVIVDEKKLRQIFVNLIGNAIKFTDLGGIKVCTDFDKTGEDTCNLIVKIHDSGPGIPENELGKLFKYFEQTSSGINKGSGTGLGLALSLEMAILMGGNITVTSEVGIGSTFTFKVEVKIGKNEITGINSYKRVICLEDQQDKYRILIVDDKEENMRVAVNFLQLVGFKTNEAINGEEAIRIFEEWEPDLILMDMRMPVMDGYEATRRIKLTEKGKKTPIVALTASAFDEEQEKIGSLDIQGYIRKPYRESELFSTIGKVLNIKYIYEEENKPFASEKYFQNEDTLKEDIIKLPDEIVIAMQDALAVADLDVLIKNIKSLHPDSSELSQHLMSLANNYQYDSLQEIFNHRSNTHAN